jgi:hypothetical protein
VIGLTLVIFIVSIVGFTFAIWGIMKWAGRKFGTRVADLHHTLEEIVEERRVPASWIEEMGRRIPGSLEHPPRRAEEAKRYLIGRLVQLRSYCKKSPMVDGPETLALLLDGLARAEREWTEQSIEAIVRRPEEAP